MFQACGSAEDGFPLLVIVFIGDRYPGHAQAVDTYCTSSGADNAWKVDDVDTCSIIYRERI